MQVAVPSTPANVLRCRIVVLYWHRSYGLCLWCNACGTACAVLGGAMLLPMCGTERGMLLPGADRHAPPSEQLLPDAPPAGSHPKTNAERSQNQTPNGACAAHFAPELQ
eukprot:817214-Rhodomonas_salina.1